MLTGVSSVKEIHVSEVEPVAQVAAVDTEEESKQYIYFKESSNRTDAINASSGACGIGQALPCNKMSCSLSDYACQDEWFTAYAMRRYGSWAQAAAFWRQHQWW